MDWAVFSMLGATAKDLKTLTFSYDICCTWSVNFWQRLKKIYNDVYQLPDDLQVNFVIPKFHLEAHGEDCKSSFNLNHTVGAARTCGEGIEAGWADTNPAALSTREMSLTYRHEILDDLFGAINWRKIRTMGAFSQMRSVRCVQSFVPHRMF
jgi:Kyakuja-Dileera-Zisupton transposase